MMGVSTFETFAAGLVPFCCNSIYFRVARMRGREFHSADYCRLCYLPPIGRAIQHPALSPGIDSMGRVWNGHCLWPTNVGDHEFGNNPWWPNP